MSNITYCDCFFTAALTLAAIQEPQTESTGVYETHKAFEAYCKQTSSQRPDWAPSISTRDFKISPQSHPGVCERHLPQSTEIVVDSENTAAKLCTGGIRQVVKFFKRPSSSQFTAC